jgi:hypothetical protein
VDRARIEPRPAPADAGKDWPNGAMADAMAPLIDPGPVGVEVKVGRTWGAEW